MTDFDRQLFLLAPLGLAFLAVGFVHIMMARLAPIWRVAISGVIFAAALGSASILADSDSISRAAYGLLPATVVLAFLVRNVRSNPSRVRSRRPLFAGLGIAGVGAALLALGVMRYESGLAEKIAGDCADMELLGYLPERELMVDRQILTDRGRILGFWRAKMIVEQPKIDDLERRSLDLTPVKPGLVRTAPATESSNCHGWVFTGGRAIIANADVDAILADNGYRTVERPVPGDIAIYRNYGLVSHTALVRAVEPGRPVEVESKWGWMGVFRHAVGDSIYGSDYSYYRSSRRDHLVKMVDRSSVQFGGAE